VICVTKGTGAGQIKMDNLYPTSYVCADCGESRFHYVDVWELSSTSTSAGITACDKCKCRSIVRCMTIRHEQAARGKCGKCRQRFACWTS